MWLCLFAITACVLMFAGVMFEQYFWWAFIGVGVLMTFAVAVEILWNLRQDRALCRQAEEETPPQVSPVAAEGEAALGKAG